MAGTTIVDRLNKLSGKDATTIPKALEYLEEEGVGGDVDWNVNDPEAKGYISNRPFYEYDDFEDEEYWDFAEEFADSIYFSNKTFKKYTKESGIYYTGTPYRSRGTTRPTTHLFRDVFEEGKAYKVKLFFDSEFFPEMEYIYIPSVYGNEIYPVSTAFDSVSFPTDYGDFVCFYHAKVGSYYAAVAACKFYVAGADDGSQADAFPDTLTFTNLKVYRLKPVKKVKKIDEKYLPIKGLNVHICTSAEYDSSTLVPTVTNPDASTLYLVPTSSKSKNMFDEYIWTGTDWEKFGTGSVALPSPTTADNGKVLGVNGGEYKLVEQSGGGFNNPTMAKVADVSGQYTGISDLSNSFDKFDASVFSVSISAFNGKTPCMFYLKPQDGDTRFSIVGDHIDVVGVSDTAMGLQAKALLYDSTKADSIGSLSLELWAVLIG